MEARRSCPRQPHHTMCQLLSNSEYASIEWILSRSSHSTLHIGMMFSKWSVAPCSRLIGSWFYPEHGTMLRLEPTSAMPLGRTARLVALNFGYLPDCCADHSAATDRVRSFPLVVFFATTSSSPRCSVAVWRPAMSPLGTGATRSVLVTDQ